MTASTSDYFKKTGTSTVTTLSAPGKPIGATSINVGSTTGYPTDTGIIISIRTVDTAGTLIAGTHTEWLATVTSGTSLAIEAVPVYGSDQIYAAGSTTQVAIRLSSYSHNKLIDGLLVEHKQTGKHSDLTADSVKTDTITGITDADSGSIYGVTVTNSKIGADSITGLKKGFIRGANFTGSVPSPAFTNAAITGMSLTITIPTGQNLRMAFGCGFVNTSAASNERDLTLMDGSTALVAIPTISPSVITGANYIYDFVGNGASHTISMSASTNVTTGTFDYRSPYMSWEIYTPVV